MPKGISGNISGKNDKHLTPKQMLFAKEYVYNDGSKTQTECALAAGYGESGAAVRASELLNPQKYPLVVRYIQGLQADQRSGHRQRQSYCGSIGRSTKR